MISALDRKLLRDLWQMKGQTLAITLVIGCGVATFIMSQTAMKSLELTQQAYYERCRFADVFSHVKRAPLTLADRINEIPGVNRVETRIVADVTLDVEGLNEPATGRLISVPDRGRPGLNDVHLRSGRWIEAGRRGEVLASEAFVIAHNLKPGQQVKAILNGRRQVLTIVGVVLSPEYVFQIKPGDLLPDDKRFGVFWMEYTPLAAAFDMQGAFNDIALSLSPDGNEQEVLRRLNRLTAPYGGDGAFGRSEQVSHHYLSDEIKQLRTTGLILPTVFLSVAAFLLNVVLTRQISTQREQIAALKAFGYSHWEVGIHYLKMVLLVVVLGMIFGSFIGSRLGQALTEMYSKFYRFPEFLFQFDASIVSGALAFSLVAGVLGTISAIRKAVKLPPAEAMRPEPPGDYRPTVIERLGLHWLLSPSSRMILRHLERKPWQWILSTIGIALATTILVLGAFMTDSIHYLVEFMFRTAQRQDVTITFVEPRSASALHEVKRLPGVIHQEPFRNVPVRFRHEHRSKRVGIMGLASDRYLYRILNTNERNVSIPDKGLVISAMLAKILDVKPGQTVTVEILEGDRRTVEVPVVAVFEDFSGTNAYMNVEALQELVGDTRTYSGVFASVDRAQAKQLYKQLKQTPKVAGVTVQEAAIQSFWDTVAENLLRMRTFNLIFAVVIASGVVYNTARISLAERSRELATLRVMGFTRGEISFILLGELAVIVMLAIPIGLVMGYLSGMLLCELMATELFRIPLVIQPATYGFATLVVAFAGLVSGLLVRRRLDHLDLVSVLKSRE